MTDTSAPASKVASAAAVTASAAALACGVCCVLPLALPAALLASTGGMLALFAGAYRWLMPVAFLFVAGGWAWVGWQSWSSRRRPARRTLVVMIVASVTLGLAASWPTIEPLAQHLLTR